MRFKQEDFSRFKLQKLNDEISGTKLWWNPVTEIQLPDFTGIGQDPENSDDTNVKLSQMYFLWILLM